MVYYIGSSIWAFKILQETQLLPSWLGGNGVKEAMMKNQIHIPEATD